MCISFHIQKNKNIYQQTHMVDEWTTGQREIEKKQQRKNEKKECLHWNCAS